MDRTSTATPLRDGAVNPQISVRALGSTLARIGSWATTAALEVMFPWFGGVKFLTFEAEILVGIVLNNPLVSWLHRMFGDGARRLPLESAHRTSCTCNL